MNCVHHALLLLRLILRSKFLLMLRINIIPILQILIH